MPRLTDLRACRRIISIRWNENESLPKNNSTTFNKLSEQFVCGVSTGFSLSTTSLLTASECTDGASLFFTSQTIPNSFTQLRQYILHRIFSPSSLALNTASVPPTSTRAFPFQHRTNVIDRDQILVPTGWDSWGKIRILREKFDCEKVGEGWEEDLNRTREASGEQGEGEGAGHRLQKEYEMVVVDFDSEDKVSSNFANSQLALISLYFSLN